MRKIRELRETDIEEVQKIAERDFPDYVFPNWMKDFIGAFIIHDENDEFVMAGGVELTAETTIITNKRMSRVKIGKSLIEAQNYSLYVCKRCGIRELHAFSNDSEYVRHLIQHGFRLRDTALSMKVP